MASKSESKAVAPVPAEEASSAATMVNPDQSLKAAKALIKHMKSAATEKAAQSSKLNPLDEPSEERGASLLSETPIILAITTKTFIADTNKLKPGKIPLPHPLITPSTTSTICLIVADPQRAYKDLVSSSSFPSELRPLVGRVVDYTHLKKKFRTFEAQRQLHSSHDIFLADDRIINRLPKVLGKTFYANTTKRPIPISISPRSGSSKTKNSSKGAAKGTGLRKQIQTSDASALSIRISHPGAIAREVTKALSCATVHLSASQNTSVRVGYASWDPAHISSNADAVAKALVSKYVPRQWANVRAIYLKGPETTSLPIWLSDHLWTGEDAVVATPLAKDEEDEEDGQKLLEEAEGGGKKKEKANTKKKRKALALEKRGAPADAEGEEEDEQEEDEQPKRKKAKKDKANKAKVDKLVASRKAKLSKDKAAARKAMD
ncbi:uncharacterized protein MKZ38_007269 [Zalerion maritima]|uniref:Ribosomal protein L1 n=1 Tax=Zalerion maritima TaxID=339359 RepID=A0AAD5RWV6_9PEZI|nr:uncharacterized protein MKZ38_007269 [Zalerion maritima]